MKNTFKTLVTFSAIAVFVILNWATSQDVEFVTLEAEAVIFQDSLIIFNNLDERDVAHANLILRASESLGLENYSIGNYSLPAMSSDTLKMIDFLNSENIPYPYSIPPIEFAASFSTEGVLVEFSTDL